MFIVLKDSRVIFLKEIKLLYFFDLVLGPSERAPAEATVRAQRPRPRPRPRPRSNTAGTSVTRAVFAAKFCWEG